MTNVTLVFVAYGVEAIDLSWAASDVPVVIVRNDALLMPVDRAGVTYTGDGDNVGFGAGVNRALPFVKTARVVICNPDVQLTAAQLDALGAADSDEVLTVRLVDNDARPTSVINRYPTPLALLLMALRLGRLIPRHSRARRILSLTLGRWGRDHGRSLTGGGSDYPLATHWPSGAVLSVATERLRQVGGFNDDYFLYFEDVDLAQRLAQRYPAMRVRVVDTPAARHGVGGSAVSIADRQMVERERWASASRYAHHRPGWRWRAVEATLAAFGRLRSGAPA